MPTHQTNNHESGLILLEVLVAVGLVTGVWISFIQAYQGLVLHLIRQEQGQVLLRQEFDRYELTERMRANSVNREDLKNDIIRVPDRSRALRSAAKSPFAN